MSVRMVKSEMHRCPKGWQLDFSKVTMDMTIAPNFEAVLKPEYAQQ